jgi:hypothetical protein
MDKVSIGRKKKKSISKPDTPTKTSKKGHAELTMDELHTVSAGNLKIGSSKWNAITLKRGLS